MLLWPQLSYGAIWIAWNPSPVSDLHHRRDPGPLKSKNPAHLLQRLLIRYMRCCRSDGSDVARHGDLWTYPPLKPNVNCQPELIVLVRQMAKHGILLIECPI